MANTESKPVGNMYGQVKRRGGLQIGGDAKPENIHVEKPCGTGAPPSLNRLWFPVQNHDPIAMTQLKMHGVRFMKWPATRNHDPIAMTQLKMNAIRSIKWPTTRNHDPIAMTQLKIAGG